jgi:hypothetical protein
VKKVSEQLMAQQEIILKKSNDQMIALINQLNATSLREMRDHVLHIDAKIG